ncbi:hypothetical protein [Streptomyces sp. 11x1]|uniref:hypothetical protein n=1 Tax=Streptomyces sp. 11x1 TaxID=3038642 RepID=UPI00292DE179|nr:hypothetical protein [Streptomyces sp. 11x1]WNZ07360.1 hypothetical protein P8T65_07005 [Streptomyces sp. 11x1]
MPYTAFAPKAAHRTEGSMIVRRAKRLNRKAAAQGQGELFATYRYHALFIDSPLLLRAESDRRGHAVVEQVLLAVTARTLTRALGALASARHGKARGATIRTELIAVAAHPARSGRDQITPSWARVVTPLAVTAMLGARAAGLFTAMGRTVGGALRLERGLSPGARRSSSPTP